MIPGSQSHIDRHRRAYQSFFRAQRSAVGGGLVVPEEWNTQLAGVFRGEAVRTISVFGAEIAQRFGGVFNVDYLDEYLDEYTRISAEATNATTAEQLKAAVDVDDPVEANGHVWDIAVGSRAVAMAVSKVTTEGNLGRHEAAVQVNVASKRWVVTSSRPRSSHARMNGQSVPVSENFDNGARWPGDASLSVDERAGCSCILDF